MAPSSSPDGTRDGAARHGGRHASPGPRAARLIDVADRAIRDGLDGAPLHLVDPGREPPALRREAATFVTLHVDEELNGCIGSIEAVEPLVHSVARNARSAAFADPRFAPLPPADVDRVDIEISILSPLEPVPATTRAGLLDELRPRTDGLVIGAARRRAVFLPAVWATLPRPEDFVAELFAKAGLPRDHWGRDVRAWTFTTATITRNGPGADPATVP